MSNTPRTKIRVPAQPLLNYVAYRGGIAALPGMGFPESEELDFGATTDKTRGQTKTNRSPDERKRFNALERRLLRAAKSGHIGYFAADEIACDYLNVHPSAIYPEWHEMAEDDALQASLADKPDTAELVAA